MPDRWIRPLLAITPLVEAAEAVSTLLAKWAASSSDPLSFTADIALLKRHAEVLRVGKNLDEVRQAALTLLRWFAGEVPACTCPACSDGSIQTRRAG